MLDQNPIEIDNCNRECYAVTSNQRVPLSRSAHFTSHVMTLIGRHLRIPCLELQQVVWARQPQGGCLHLR
jgi:hypothetical protein